MRKLTLRLALLLAIFAIPALASTTVTKGTGTCAIAGTSCTPSASAPLHIEIFGSVRAASTTAPGNMSTATSIGTKSGTSSAMRIMCRVEYSTTPAASGTSANATDVAEDDWVGTNVRTLGACATPGMGIGNQGTAASGTTTSTNCPAITLNDSSGASTVVCVMYNAGGTGTQCTPSGMTADASATIGDIYFFYKTGVSSFSSATCTNGVANNWIAMDVEIQGLPANPPVLSQLVFARSSGQGNYAGQANAANNIQLYVDPKVIGGGNGVLFPVVFKYSATRTISLVDDKGDTATTLGSICSNTGNGTSFAWEYFQNITAGATVFTLSWDASLTGFMIEGPYQFKGVLTSGTPNDGSPSCVSTNSRSGTALNNISDTTGITPGTNGDIIVSAFADDSSSLTSGSGGASGITDLEFASGFTGLGTGQQFGFIGQAEIQSTAALIKPSATIVQSGSDNWLTSTLALKTQGGAGSTPAGKILRQQLDLLPGTGSSTFASFPCDTGNFIEISSEDNSNQGGSVLGVPVDSAANTYTQWISGSGNNYPVYAYSNVGAICNGQGFIWLPYTAHSGGSAIVISEVEGVASVDTGSRATGTFSMAAATTLAANVTSAGQTAWTLAAGGGIATNDYLLIGTGSVASYEVVKCTAGCGTTSITVTRGGFGTTALSSITSGTSLFESLNSNQPSITTGSNNELVFAAMNQGQGPNYNTANCSYDFGAFAYMLDALSTFANGDGVCHQYVATAGTTAIGWYNTNGAQTETGFSSAFGVVFSSSAASIPRRGGVQ